MSIGHNESPTLVADIGGTNARFALIQGESHVPTQEMVLSGCDFPSPVEAIEHYLAQLNAPRPRAAAIAIANPITGDWVKMTNHVWEFSIEQTRKALEEFNRLPPEEHVKRLVASGTIDAHGHLLMGRDERHDGEQSKPNGDNRTS